MTKAYDPNNVFAKILRGEIPCEIILKTAHALAFRDIRPAAPVHVLVIPTGPYRDYADYVERATHAEKEGFDRLVLEVLDQFGLRPLDKGYRIITNAGAYGMQEVPHYHVHILSGEELGSLRV